MLCAVLLLAFVYGQAWISINPSALGKLSDFAGLANGAAGAVLAFSAAFALYLVHPYFEKRSFGEMQEVASESPLFQRAKEISVRLGVEMPRLLMDRDIANGDAVAMGLPGKKTILMGRGLLLLFIKRPEDFDAIIAHELGHIKNKDVAVAFFARALIVVSFVFLSAAIILYFSQLINIFVRIWPKWPGGHESIVEFATVRFGWIGFNLMMLAVLAGKTLFWVVILRIQYGAFLRVRESYADITAASIVGPQPMKGLLAGGLTSEAAKKESRSFQIFSVHPNLKERIRAVGNPLMVLRPGIFRLGWNGYMIGLGASVVESIDHIPEVDANTMEEALNSMFTDAITFFLLLFFTIIIFATILSIMSMLINLSVWFNLSDIPTFHKTRILIIGIVGFICGLELALSVNPQSIHDIVNSLGDLDAILLDSADMIVGIFFVGIAFVGWLLVSVVVWRLITSSRSNAPGRFRWVAISLLIFFALEYIFGIAGVVTDQAIVRRGDAVSTSLILLSIAFAFWFAAYLVARRSFSLRFQPASEKANWVFEPTP
ncbi:hypothetical protein ADU59_16760 [Pararhizobium polonicum]|uniref:Peptidase M48 domain-containing protein n=1 Tax=Pararhizobium polonicum TaxID=1612624 RepID=A0A1C7NZA8_9HYPH|nr:M48 family metalloprotease [Pararhizobium polonicum]OBZ94329.1 hypothetical protein ADU59_16760 [Pararhizobium polonicum]